MLRTSLIAACGLLSAPSAFSQMTFSDVTDQKGFTLPLPNHGAGAAVGDYNGDGWLDICVFGAVDPVPQLFRNNGELAQIGLADRWFENVTSEAFPEGAPPTSGGLFVDIDNDGDHDLVMTRRYYHPLTGEPDKEDTGVVYFENKNGKFRPGEADPYLARADGRHGGLAMADVDVDGDLDVVYAHSGKSTLQNNGGPGSFLLNDGIPRLLDATTQFGADIDSYRKYWSVILADFNGDLLPDLHCAVDFGVDFHCRNVGNGNFVDATSQAGTSHVGADMGLAHGDMDNDGDLDIYSTNINIGVLYVNDGAGHFVDDSVARGVKSWGQGISTIGWGTVFTDFDHDEDLDLAFCGYGDPGHLYENDGAGYFTEVDATSGLTLRGHGLIAFDYDRDGDQDLALIKKTLSGPRLYENVTPALGTNHWLTVELEGTDSNRDGIGAKVELRTEGGVIQTRWIVAGSSFKNGVPHYAHFGLGGHTSATIKVTWPNGRVQIRGPIPADQYLTIVEE